MTNYLVFPGVFVGGSISIICIILLLYSNLQAFKTRAVTKPIKISAILVFIGFLINAFCVILGQAVIPREKCTLRIPISLGSFLLGRGLLFYFLIIRIEVSFKDSSLALPSCLMRSLKVITIVVYGLCMVAQCAFAADQEYKNGVCFISYEMFTAYVAMQGIYSLTDFILGVFCVGIYVYRLYGLYKEVKIMGAMDATPDNANIQLLHTIKKQAKLAYIAYLSTVFIVILAPALLGVTYLGYIDALVNVLCVYCTFDMNHKMYKYLCDCNGIRPLQIICCYCGCCCCNEGGKYVQKKKSEPQKLENVSSKVSVSTKKKDVSSNKMSETCDV